MEQITLILTKRQIEIIYNCLPFSLLPWDDDNGKKRPSVYTEDEVEKLGDIIEGFLYE